MYCPRIPSPLFSAHTLTLVFTQPATKTPTEACARGHSDGIRAVSAFVRGAASLLMVRCTGRAIISEKEVGTLFPKVWNAAPYYRTLIALYTFSFNGICTSVFEYLGKALCVSCQVHGTHLTLLHFHRLRGVGVRTGRGEGVSIH